MTYRVATRDYDLTLDSNLGSVSVYCCFVSQREEREQRRNSAIVKASYIKEVSYDTKQKGF